MEYSDEIKSMNLWHKISAISSEIDYLQKDDSVGTGNNAYRAISSEKVIGICAEKMNKYGIVIYPIEQTYSRTDESIKDKYGNDKFNRISDVDVKYEVVNIHKCDERLVTVASGTGVDTQDKGVGKAQTYAYKNMLIKLFAIPTGDDTDKIHSDDYTKKLYGEDVKTPIKTTKTEKPIPTNNITDKQVNRLLAIAKSKGYTPVEVKTAIIKKYGVTEISHLSKVVYDHVVAGYEGAPVKGVK